MKEIKSLTTEELLNVVSESFEFHNIDSAYYDMGQVLYAIAANCEIALKVCPECLDSEVEKANFKYLRNILETCANMMMDCDEMFRK